MLTISQHAEICVEHCPSGVLTSCTTFIAVLTVFIRRVVNGSWSLRTGCLSLMVVLAQQVENLKNSPLFHFGNRFLFCFCETFFCGPSLR